MNADTDPLFQLPLGEFTAARNALASTLKKAGRQDDAERVKSLARPSISAWVANQLYWRHRQAFDRLMAAGEQFRRAQAAQLAGRTADMRGPLEARRAALAEMLALAHDTLASSEHAATPGLMRRLTTTLEALSAIGGGPDAPRPGRLVGDVDPPGFETLAALVPVAGSGTGGGGERAVLRFTPREAGRKESTPRQRPQDDDRARRAAAKAALEAAQRQLREARAAAMRARDALTKAAARVRTAESARVDAERRLERATADVAGAKQAARKTAADAEAAAQAVADAEREVERARGN